MRLREVASVVRSKLAGPFILTIDVFVHSRETYFKIKSKKLINEELISRLYRVPREKIRIIYCDHVNGIKIAMPMPKPPGEPGCRDIYGAQQHIPLLNVAIE